MNRGVIWLLIIAVVVIGLFFIFRRPGEVEEKKEEIEQKQEQMQEQPRREELASGTYSGESDRDDHGDIGSIVLQVRDGKISNVDYQEIRENNEPKGEDYPYPKALEAMQELEKQLVEKQDPDEVDDVAGATSTSNKFRTAAKRALEKAK